MSTKYRAMRGPTKDGDLPEARGLSPGGARGSVLVAGAQS